LETYIEEIDAWEPVVKEFHYVNLNDIDNKKIEPNFIIIKFKDNNGNIYNKDDPAIDSLNGVYILYNDLLGKEFTWTM